MRGRGGRLFGVLLSQASGSSLLRVVCGKGALSPPTMPEHLLGATITLHPTIQTPHSNPQCDTSGAPTCVLGADSLAPSSPPPAPPFFFFFFLPPSAAPAAAGSAQPDGCWQRLTAPVGRQAAQE